MSAKTPPPSDDLLAFADWAAAESSASAAAAPAEAQTLWVGVGLAGGELALPVESVREIVRVGEMRPVPGAPAHVKGLANVRGAILPVVDVRARLGLSAAGATPASRVVLVDVDGRILGLLVDRVTRMLRVKDSERVPSAPDAPECVTGEARMEGAAIALLDPRELVAPQAKRRGPS
jgi:purine-binding chemotaxis protein CheW